MRIVFVATFIYFYKNKKKFILFKQTYSKLTTLGPPNYVILNNIITIILISIKTSI